VDDILRRFWENLAGRSSGPMSFRLVIQPVVASGLAIRAGIKDAHEGHPAFLWAALINREYRRELLRNGWRDVWKVFVLAVVLDAVYQLFVQRGVYLLELLVVATVLAVVPYVVIRGPVSRIAAFLIRRTDRRVAAIHDGRSDLKGERH
jgi:hypothetical protein